MDMDIMSILQYCYIKEWLLLSEGSKNDLEKKKKEARNTLHTMQIMFLSTHNLIQSGRTILINSCIQ